MALSSVSAAILTIDLDGVVENWRRLSHRAAPAVCGAVVKADAYGLGAREVAGALYRAGCRRFFVALVDEGIALRVGLPADATIYVMHGAFPGAEADCFAHGLLPVLNTPDQIERLQALAHKCGRTLGAALQIDTGMARLGLQTKEVARLSEQPGQLAGIQLHFVMSHLVSAEEPTDPLNAEQQRRFNALRSGLPSCAASLANSSGIFLGKGFHFDLVRPGAGLYGVAPSNGGTNPMRSVVRLQARLIQVREVSQGDGVGYNTAWTAKQPSRIGTVSVGYADGYLRSLCNRATLRYQQHVLPLVGRVSMDLVTVDLSHLPRELPPPNAFIDVLDDEHDINALAVEAGTSAYEILTQLGPRYERRYLGDSSTMNMTTTP